MTIFVEDPNGVVTEGILCRGDCQLNIGGFDSVASPLARAILRSIVLTRGAKEPA